MEYEIRYYKPLEEIKVVIEKLNEIKELNKSLRTYEKTTQYNHCDKRFNFYSKEIDGRFRIRVSKNENTSKCKISWKRRLNKLNNNINAEEEKEININIEEYDNLIFLIENAMKFDLIESYERYRTTYSNKDIEIAVDEYPFGIALEIESKTEINPEKNIEYWLNVLNLKKEESYNLSWDDKYKELCDEQNITCYKDVTFDKKMPEIKGE